MKIEIAGENALLLTFGSEIDPAVLGQVQRATELLVSEAPSWLVDLIPSYASLLVLFDPVCIDRISLRQFLRSRLAHLASHPAVDDRLSNNLEIPVYYSEESGPDLAKVARHTGLDIEEVIALHRDTEYRVYALGFAPGFAYLGQLPQSLAMPRLDTPRQRVPRGAVAIAERQTAVYPISTPGGWNLLGLCPLPLFVADRDPPILWQVGDRVRFRSIERDEFITLGGELP